MAATGTDREPVGELRRSIGLRGLAAVGGLVATFFTTVVAVRALEPREAATMLAVLAALMLGPMVGRLGLGQNVLRTLSSEADPAAARRLAGAHLRMATASAAVSSPLVALAATAGLIGRPDFWPVAALTALLVVLESVRLMLSDVFAASGLVREAVLTTHHVRTLVVLPVLLVTIQLAEPTLMMLLLVYAATGVLLILVVAGPTRRCVQFTGRSVLRGSVRATLIAGIALLVVDASLFVVGRGDVWLAAALFEASDAAHYSTASTLAFQVCVVDGLASLAMTPIAARMWALGQRAELLRLLAAVSTLSAVATATAVLGLAVLGEFVLGAAYGPSFQDAYLVLLVLGLGGLAKVTVGMNVTLMIAMGRLRLGATTAAVTLLVAIPTVVLAALWFGPTGLAVGTAVAAVALPVGQFLAARRALREAGVPGGRAPWAYMDPRRAWREVRRTRPDPAPVS